MEVHEIQIRGISENHPFPGLHQQFVLILRQARGMAAIVEGRDETLTSWIGTSTGAETTGNPTFYGVSRANMICKYG